MVYSQNMHAHKYQKLQTNRHMDRCNFRRLDVEVTILPHYHMSLFRTNVFVCTSELALSRYMCLQVHVSSNRQEHVIVWQDSVLVVRAMYIADYPYTCEFWLSLLQ